MRNPKKYKYSILSIFLLISWLTSAAYEPHFSSAGFYPLEGTGRQAYSMNVAWRFIKMNVPDAEAPGFDDSGWEVVSLPHGLEYLPIDASGGVNYQGPVWYRKHFIPGDHLKGKNIFLHFEAIMGKSTVWINGVKVSEHFGGYLPVIADVSKYIQFGQDNVIAVLADNSDDSLYPPGKEQSMLDFCYFGGIYRDCWLIAHNNVYITNANFEKEVGGGGLFVSFDKVSKESALVNLKLHLRNEQNSKFSGNVEYELTEKNGTIVNTVTDKLTIAPNSTIYSLKTMSVKQPMLWSPESPTLYYLNVRVKDSKGNVMDGYRQRIGIRSIEFRQKDGLWLNGSPYPDKLIGTNRHQDFAVVGNALPNSMQWRDAKKLRDAGMKVIRTHYVIDPAFMDACDELGLFNLVETPGWQFWNDSTVFEERVYSDIRNIIRIHRNHACLFFWEPILNETDYPDHFAKNAANICKEEYPYPSGISACDDGAKGSQYFSLLLRPAGKLDSTKTYFVREWGDNVDDWKAQNSDSRVNRGWGEVPMLVQALHYGKPGEVNEKWPIQAVSQINQGTDPVKQIFNGICLQNLYTSPKQIVGACFWHSFDHQRGYSSFPFYGGFMDAFRQPKYSYYMFQSQREPVKSDLIAETGPMVFIAHEMTPFSPHDVTVYSNCDEVRLTFLKNGKQKIYKKEPNLKGMPSPIILFSDMYDFMSCKAKSRAGKQDEVYLLAEGVMGGKVVCTHKVSLAGSPNNLVLWLDNEDVNLIADGSDFVTVIAGIADKNGNIKRLTNEAVKFEIEGEGRLLGGSDQMINPRPVLWGTAPILVQSTTNPGEITIRASIVHEGIHKPVSGELTIKSIKNTIPAIFDQKEIDQIKKQIVPLIHKSINKSDMELEIQKLRKELNDLKLEDVGKQQNKFGNGIN